MLWTRCKWGRKLHVSCHPMVIVVHCVMFGSKLSHIAVNILLFVTFQRARLGHIITVDQSVLTGTSQREFRRGFIHNSRLLRQIKQHETVWEITLPFWGDGDEMSGKKFKRGISSNQMDWYIYQLLAKNAPLKVSGDVRNNMPHHGWLVYFGGRWNWTTRAWVRISNDWG